jgi:uncharacterized protein
MRRRFPMTSGKECQATKSARPAAKRTRERATTTARRKERNVETAPPRSDRLLPAADLPGYTYVPGTSTPHPIRDPRGHSHNRKGRTSFPLSPENWADNRTFLLALDFFNAGFYWEAHEEWERLWRISGPESAVGRFLRGLIKLAAAGVKVREYSIHGVRRHAASAGEVFADVAAEIGTDRFCGLEFTMLQFAADRAAQISYDREFPVGKPIRVFPFVIQPEPMPFAEI